MFNGELGLVPRGQHGQGVLLSIQLHLARTLIVGEAIPVLPDMPPRREKEQM